MAVLDEESHVRAALDSVLAQAYPGSLDVCVAVGPSRDRTEEVVRAVAATDHRVHMIANPTGGRCSGLNAAIRATSGDVVVRVDGRTVLPPGYVARAVATKVRTGAANVGGVQRAVGSTPFTTAVADALSSPFGMGGARYHAGGSDGPVDTVFLGVFDRAALVAVGGFDETLVGNEDYELNYRLRRAGGTVWFDSELSVDYSPRPSLRSLARQFANYGAWKRAVVRRHPASLRLRQLAPPIVVVALVASIVVAFWQPLALVVPAAYAVGIGAAAVAAASSPSNVLRLLAIFPTMHLAWGAGFLVGRGRARR